MFQAFVTPPIVAAVFLGAFWKRFTSWGAVAALVGGVLCIWLSKEFPILVKPFAHGVEPDKYGQYNYMTACFGVLCSALIGVLVSLVTRPKSDAEIAGLWIGTMDFSMKRFKGGEPNHAVGRTVVARPTLSDDGTTPPTHALTHAEYAALPQDGPPAQDPYQPEYAIVRLGPEDLDRLKARPGDLLYVSDARRWLGGLRSVHCRAGEPHDQGNVVLMAEEAFKRGSFLAGRPVRVEKIL